MRTLLLLTLAFGTLICVSARGSDPVAVAGKQLAFKVAFYQGDINTPKTNPIPKHHAVDFLALENSSFPLPFIRPASSDPALIRSQLAKLGSAWTVEGKTGSIDAGTIPLDITFVNTISEESDLDHIEFHAESTRVISTVKLGESYKFQVKKGRGDKQVWAELKVEEIRR